MPEEKVKEVSNEGTRKELAKKINTKIKNLNDVEKLEHLVKDNKIEFEIDKVTYRVRKSNYKESEKVRQQRNVKKIELLEHPKYKLRDELIRLYRRNGKDIKEMERIIKSFPSKIESIQERLATTTAPKDIDLLEDEIKKLEERQLELILEKNECLECCIENQITDYANLYTIYLVLEKNVNEKWVKAFKSYEEFLENDEVIIQGSTYLSLLIYRREIKE